VTCKVYRVHALCRADGTLPRRESKADGCWCRVIDTTRSVNHRCKNYVKTFHHAKPVSRKRIETSRFFGRVYFVERHITAAEVTLGISVKYIFTSSHDHSKLESDMRV
jgi:hypothetical protein